ncbi:MAG TPA: TonB-dependent receptor [Bryobacteraceae bacterium]|nr:TonB-dependent receptor [Bryobacteraceae bacterium]
MKTAPNRTRWRVALLAFAVPVAYAQLYTGSLLLTVVDPSGAPVPHAKITLTDVGHGTEISAETDRSGEYVFRALPPGGYKVKVDANGFEPFELENIGIEVNSRLLAEAKLRLSVARETVVVHVEPAITQVGDATMGLTVDEKLINELPLVDRNPFDLAFLAPGVSQAPGTTYGNGVSTPGFVTNFVSDGSRNAQGDMLLDGVSVMNSDNNPGVQKALYVPPVEAIQEFKIQQANFSAEFGNSGGTIVNVVTRSGSNAYHGELFEFLRNNDLNANNFFANSAGLAQAHSTRNDFGVTAGGPILKNRTFFFFDFNGIRALTGATSSLAGVPDQAERAGNFGELCGRVGGTFNSEGICSNPAGQIYDPYTGQPNAQNQAVNRAPIPFDNLATYISPGNPNIPFGLGNLPATPGNLIDPVGAKLIQAFPLPNLNVGTPAYDPYHNWVTSASSPYNQQSFDIKLDQHFSDKDTASVRFSHEWDAGENPNFFGTVYDTNTQGPTKHAALVGDVNYTHTFSPVTLATVSIGYAHNWYPTEGVAASFGGFDPVKELGMPAYMDTSGFLTPPSIWLFSAYGCNGFNGCLGGQFYSILKFASETGHLVGSIDHVKGRHEIKFGGELRRHRINFLQAGAPNGLFAFTNSGTASGTAGAGGDALAGLMIGYADNPFSEYEIPPYTSTRNYQVGGFIQDNWRVTEQLTLNFGLRYDVDTPRTERFNQMSYFNPSAPAPITVPGLNLHGAVEYVGVNGNPGTEFNTDWGDVGPRFGFAYRVLDRTVLRGGYGIYYDPSDVGVVGNAVSGGFLGYDAVTTGVNNVPAEPWLPLEFLRDPFPFGIQTAVGNKEGAATLLGQALTNIPVRSLSQTPQEQSWSFGVQRQLPWSLLLDLEYDGRKGTHLYAMGYNDQIDALPPAVAAEFRADPSYYLQQVPNPFYGVIQGSADLSNPTIPRWKLSVPFPQYSSGAATGISSSFVPWANSIYNGAQVSVSKRFSQGLEFLFSYVFQKSLDDSSLASSGYSFLTGGLATAEPNARDPNNLRLDRSLSTFSIPQIAQLTFIYQLPFGRGRKFGSDLNRVADTLAGGWQVNGIYRVDDGLPLQLDLCGGCSVSLPTYGNQYPDLLAPLRVAGTGNLNQYFANPQVAVRPAPYSDGDAPRVLPNARMPGTDNLTASLFKEIPLRFREDARLQIRLEAFNVLNRVQFAAPDTNVGDATFGQITAQANQPRQVQAALRLYF